MRRLLPDDLTELLALYADAEVTRYIPDAPTTAEQARAELEWHVNGPAGHPQLGLWATIDRATGRFVGRCGLLPWTIDDAQEVEIAFLLARDRWGQGLATEVAEAIRNYAFEVLGLSRLVCLIDAEHRASIRVAEKIGMVFEREAHDELVPFHIYAVHRPS